MGNIRPRRITAAVAALAVTLGMAAPAIASTTTHTLKADRAEWKSINDQFDRAAGPADKRLKHDDLPQLLADVHTIGLALRHTENPLSDYRWSPRVAKDIRALVLASDVFSHDLVGANALTVIQVKIGGGYFESDGTAVTDANNAVDRDLGLPAGT